jgi:threonyl-tRNA synthetase
VLPERFDVEFVDASGARARPLMLHRATLGSLERFLGIVLEQHEGRLPGWLAPDQVAVLPIEAGQHDYARELFDELAGRGLRVVCDERNETLSRRVALAHEQAVPFVCVVGRREQSARTVNLRQGDVQSVLPLDQAVTHLVTACRPPL